MGIMLLWKHDLKHDRHLLSCSVRCLPLEAQEKRSRSSRRASTASHILCIDYIGGHFETKHFEMELRKLVEGIQVRSPPCHGFLWSIISMLQH